MRKIFLFLGVSMLLLTPNVYCQRVYQPSCERSIHVMNSCPTRFSTSYLINNPLQNTILSNYGDTIVELVSPSPGDQGTQGSCNAWAMGYGCGSIHAYSAYQDMNWAKRSPAFGKRIYTPVPMREWEGGIYIGDILD